MHGGAVTLAREFMSRTLLPDVLLVTDMLDLAAFLALTRNKSQQLKTVLYMHENQLTYPLPEDPGKGAMRRQKGERDLHYAFINYTSMLCADRIVFNSHFHKEDLFEALPRFLGHFPEFREVGNVPALLQKSIVLPVGIDWEGLRAQAKNAKPRAGRDPLILWNQRWEYDKNLEEFLCALREAAEEKLPFEVALCGQTLQKQSEEFRPQIDELGERVIHLGFADEGRYRKLLAAADITVSTAFHEFFGISIVEAITCGVFPIVPARLSYPELIPETFHSRSLYTSHQELLIRLRSALSHQDETAKLAQDMSVSMQIYDWRRIAPAYDQALEETASSPADV